MGTFDGMSVDQGVGKDTFVEFDSYAIAHFLCAFYLNVKFTLDCEMKMRAG